MEAGSSRGSVSISVSVVSLQFFKNRKGVKPLEFHTFSYGCLLFVIQLT